MKAGRPRKGEQAVLAGLGISKKVSMVAQQFAALPPDIRGAVAERRMTMKEALRIYRLAKRIAKGAE